MFFGERNMTQINHLAEVIRKCEEKFQDSLR